MEEEKFTDGFKGEGEMLERGGGARGPPAIPWQHVRDPRRHGKKDVPARLRLHELDQAVVDVVLVDFRFRNIGKKNGNLASRVARKVARKRKKEEKTRKIE